MSIETQKVMTGEMVQAGIFIVVFLILLAAITVASGSKLSKLFHVLADGAKKEFVTKPGWVSLATFFVVAAMCFAFLLIHEVKSFLVLVFHLQDADQWFTLPLAIGAPILTLTLNFIFIG